MNHRVELLEENIKRSGYSLAEAKATIALVVSDNTQLTEKLVPFNKTSYLHVGAVQILHETL